MSDILIGLTGRAGSGKDTVAEHLVQAHGFIRHAFADYLRDMWLAFFARTGISEEWLTARALKEEVIPQLGASGRVLMQTLGTEVGRGISPTLWIDATALELGLSADAAKAMPVHDRIVITDVRFANEAEAVRSWRGALWCIKRAQAAAVRAHESEAQVDAIACHAAIDNSGSVWALHDQVDALVAQMERSA